MAKGKLLPQRKESSAVSVSATERRPEAGDVHLTIRVSRDLRRRLHVYSRENETTAQAIITSYLEELLQER